MADLSPQRTTSTDSVSIFQPDDNPMVPSYGVKVGVLVDTNLLTMAFVE